MLSRIAALIVVFILLCLKPVAQNCDKSLLFKKGAELEYRTYIPKTKLFSSKEKFFEVTRLTFIVDDVKDSNNVRYSYITKKGVAADEDKDSYEKKYVITCNGEQISVPADFYITDTIYLSDIYPKVNFRKKKFYMATNNKETVLYSFSLNTDKARVDISPNKLTSEIETRDYGWERVDERGRRIYSGVGGQFQRTAQIVEVKHSIESTLAAPQVQGKEKLTVPAGTYDCYESTMKIKNTYTLIYPVRIEGPAPDLHGKTIEGAGTFYFSPEVGLVKTGNITGGYTELFRIKR